MARTASHRRLILRVVIALLGIAGLIGMWFCTGTRALIYGVAVVIGLEVFKWIVLKDDD